MTPSFSFIDFNVEEILWYLEVKFKLINYVFKFQTSSGYIQMKMEEEVPIFSKSKREFNPADKITHVAIANKYMVVAMANGILFRINLHQPDQQDGKLIFK